MWCRMQNKSAGLGHLLSCGNAFELSMLSVDNRNRFNGK